MILTATEIVYGIIIVLLVIILLFLTIYFNKLRHKKELIKEEQINLSNIVDISPQEFKPEWFETKSHDAETAKTSDPATIPMAGLQAVSGDLKMRSDLELEDDLIEFDENIDEEIPIHAETDDDEDMPENPIDAEIKKQLIAFTAEIDGKYAEPSDEIKEQSTEMAARKKTTRNRKAVKKSKSSRRKKK